MIEFVAVTLICLSTTPSDDCTEKTAVDVMSTVVDSELRCTAGWQEDIARSAFRDEVGKTTYVRTLCTRKVTDDAK